MKILFFPMTVLALTVPNCEVAAQELRETHVSVGEHELYFVVQGPETVLDETVVLLEAGGGNASDFWSELQPEIARTFGVRVVSYDRAGHGRSSLPNAPYDIRSEVRSLMTGLDSLGLNQRVVVVAHSYGGLLAQVLAAERPESVSGIVFMDPNTASSFHVADFRALLNDFVAPDPISRSDSANARVRDALAETMVTVYREAPLPKHIPVVVITAERGPWGEDAEWWKEAHQFLASTVESGEWLLAEGAEHDIIPARADLVLESVGRMLGRRE